MNCIAGETERLKSNLDEEVARQLPWVQAIHAAPAFTLAQHGSPAAILALTDEPTELAYVEAMRHYARAVAHALEGYEGAFKGKVAALEAAAVSSEVVAMAAQGFPAPDIVKLAAHVAQGRFALANINPAAAVKSF